MLLGGGKDVKGLCCEERERMEESVVGRVKEDLAGSIRRKLL